MSVRFDVTDHVARVTIDRPDRMNAVDAATEAELSRIWALVECGFLKGTEGPNQYGEDPVPAA